MHPLSSKIRIFILVIGSLFFSNTFAASSCGQTARIEQITVNNFLSPVRVFVKLINYDRVMIFADENPTTTNSTSSLMLSALELASENNNTVTLNCSQYTNNDVYDIKINF